MALLQPLLNYTFYLLLSPVLVSSCYLRFLVSPNLSFAFFFPFPELYFSRFRYKTVLFEYLLWFYVHFLQIVLESLQMLLDFREPFTSCCSTFDYSPCVWLVPFHEGSKMISKTSRPYCKFLPVFQVIAYTVPYGSSFPNSRFTFKCALARYWSHYMNVLFLILRYDRPKEEDKQKISSQVV